MQFSDHLPIYTFELHFVGGGAMMSLTRTTHEAYRTTFNASETLQIRKTFSNPRKAEPGTLAYELWSQFSCLIGDRH